MTLSPLAPPASLSYLPLPGERIRVLQLVATGTNGGAQEHVAALLDGLDARRFDVRVVSLSGGSSVARWRDRGALVEVIEDDDDAAVNALAEHIEAWAIQILHAHMFRAEVVGARAAARVGSRGLPKPWVLGHIHSSRVRSAADQALLRDLDPSIDRLIAVSRAIEAKLRAERPARPPVSLIPNGVDLERFGVTDVPSAAGARWRAAPRVGCVARLEPEKGHDTLLRAWGQVLDYVPGARLWVVGEGSLLHSLQAELASLDLPPESVVFTGRRDDIPALMASFDVVVLPSRREAQGLAVLEAMASARPIVASRVGGIVEMLEDGISGLLVPPDDAEALGRAIVRLLADRDLATRLGRGGRQVAQARYGVEEMLASISALYEEGAEAWARGADIDAVA